VKDMRKTKQQLADELSAARERISELQTAVSGLEVKSEGIDSDEKFRSIFEESQDVLVVVDTESGAILSANPTISHVLNYQPPDIVGKHFSTLYPSGKDPDEESADSVRIHGAVIEAQEIIKSDGSVLLMDLTATLIPWDGTTAILFTLRDASERVEAENALRENEEQLRTITNAMPDLVCFKDGEGRWLQANDYAVELFDLQEIDYNGKTDFELAHRSTFHYDTLIRLGKLDEQTWKCREDCRYEEVITRSNGAVSVLDVIRVPFFRRDGGRKGLVVIGRDITAGIQAQQALREAHDQLELRVELRTKELAAANKQLLREIAERSKAEEAAQLSEQRFRAILETATDCIFIKDKSFLYTFVNPWMESLLGLTAADIIGKDDEFLYGKQAAEHLRGVDTRVLAGEVIEEENTRTVKGTPTTFLDIRAPMKNDDGEVVGICGISHDITERTRPRRGTVSVKERYPSEAMRKTMATARKAAQSDSIVLLTGESGVGKDYFARFIHERSKRSGGPFFAINCAAVAPELAESELFGHEAGSFHRGLGSVERAPGTCRRRLIAPQ
jgi:PAS domain S-box-containing protein